MAGGLIKGKGIIGLAWVSYTLAVVGGCAITASFLGDWISAIVGIFWDWFAPVAFILGLLWMLIDLVMDGTPNRPAIWLAILLPSVARSVNGLVGQKVNEWADQLNAWMSQKLGEYVGAGSLTMIAFVATGAALIIARRVVQRSKANRAGGLGIGGGIGTGAGPRVGARP
jgi:hypothetical protein